MRLGANDTGSLIHQLIIHYYLTSHLGIDPQQGKHIAPLSSELILDQRVT